MKFTLAVLACALVITVAARSRPQEAEDTSRAENGSHHRSSRRRSRVRGNPDAKLDEVQTCLLCREIWSEALGAFNEFTSAVRTGAGTITNEKTCRGICSRKAAEQVKDMSREAADEMACTSCRSAIDFWRAQPSKKPHYQLAKQRMCGNFSESAVRDDCEHTVRMYGFDTFAAIRNDVSSSSICHMYNMCGREIEIDWTSAEAEEKDEKPVTLDELRRESDRRRAEADKTEEKDEEDVASQEVEEE